MWLLTLVLLVLLGLLGIMDWLKAKNPDTARQLQPLEQFESVIGTAGVVWGILLLLRWLMHLGANFFSGGMLVALLTALVVVSLSLILALPMLRSMFGESDFMARVARLVDRLMPYKLGLGIACLVLALFSLVNRAF
jgi:Fe2+ transport system protein B